jgi:hypothetical protein
MCVGLSEGGTNIFDLDADPWNTIKKRGIKPTRIEYAVYRESRRQRTGVSQSALNGCKNIHLLTSKTLCSSRTRCNDSKY